MNIKSYLRDYQKRANEFLDDFFQKEQKKALEISSLCAEAVRLYRDFMKGGKMLRGALTTLGYSSAGGTQTQKIIAPSVGVEILHSFLLIHDDWIDSDLKRRGKPTIHQQYLKIHHRDFDRGDPEKWAGSMSLVLGDLGCFLGQKLIIDSNFSSECKIKALSFLSPHLLRTAYGQFEDISYDLLPELEWERILKIRELKTAYYTLVMPLQVGMALAGADQEQLKKARDYGLPVGVAFQLRDDYLGLFGKEKVTGKSTTSDLKEGKKTLIFAKALQSLEGEQKKQLKQALEKKELTEKEVQRVKQMVKKSGAPDFCQDLAQDLVAKGKKVIPELSSKPELAEIYSSMADFMIKREK